MKYIVGAYVTCPCLFEWDESLATQYMEGIKRMPLIRGLEHPFWGSLHPFDENWFLNNIDATWDFVLTCIPGTMVEMLKNSVFGLASDSDSGRTAALEHIEMARRAVVKLNSHLERNAVIAVQLHSAPTRSGNICSSKASFVKSLREIKSWDWQGARLVIEHCDAAVSGQVPEKGFLSLHDEIDSARVVNENSPVTPMGIAINWGRSAIEERNTTVPLRHIGLAKNAELLSGLMFSGCSDKETMYGVWKDTHMPPPQEFDSSHYAEHSLMTAENIRESLVASSFTELDYCGIKIMDLSTKTNLSRRIGLNIDTLKLLDRVTNEIKDVPVVSYN